MVEKSNKALNPTPNRCAVWFPPRLRRYGAG